MRSNYKKIGPYIREVVEKNNDLAVELLLGVSVSKEFIPSIANIIGTDMSTYKIVRKDQFAYGPVTSRNSNKVSIALLNLEECIVSTSYTVFEIIDHEALLPEYLMMWFRRPEFDRYARFKSHGSVRELFDWEEMCDVELPMPTIEKQREIVKEYHTIVYRIKLNEQLNQKLEETAQAIYKQWFVDFEFPISAEYAVAIGRPELEGQPYKSNGGEMVFNKDIDTYIPPNWSYGSWNDLASIFSGHAFDGELYSLENGLSVVRGENVSEQKLRWDTHKKWDYTIPKRAENCYLMDMDIVVGMDGSKVGKNWALIGKFELPLILAQRVSCVRAKEHYWQPFIYLSMFFKRFENYVAQVTTGTSVPHISGSQILDFPSVIPEPSLVNKYSALVTPVLRKIHRIITENKILNNVNGIILSRMAMIKD